MLQAFTLASFSPWSVVSLLFTAAWQTVLSHGVSLSMVGLVIAAIAIMVFVPGGFALVRTALGAVAHVLLGTATGRIVLLGLACLVGGWEVRAYLDTSIALRQQLAAQVAATDAAKAAATAAQLQAVALRDLQDAAAKRAQTAESKSADLQDQVGDYAAQLVATSKGAKTPPRSYALTAADVAALRAIGAPAAPKSR